MTNAASTRSIARAKEQSRKDSEGEKFTIQNLMRHPMSRRWLWLLLGDAQVFAGNMNLDPAYMAFEKGQRNFGLRLLTSILRHSPEEYIRMTNENSSANLKEESDGGDADDLNDQ